MPDDERTIRAQPVEALAADGRTVPGELLTCLCGSTIFHVIDMEGMGRHMKCARCPRVYCSHPPGGPCDLWEKRSDVRKN